MTIEQRESILRLLEAVAADDVVLDHGAFVTVRTSRGCLRVEPDGSFRSSTDREPTVGALA